MATVEFIIIINTIITERRETLCFFVFFHFVAMFEIMKFLNIETYRTLFPENFNFRTFNTAKMFYCFS